MPNREGPDRNEAHGVHSSKHSALSTFQVSLLRSDLLLKQTPAENAIDLILTVHLLHARA
jgi:hypothetical protein